MSKPQQSVSIDEIPTEQLAQIQKQLDAEIETLTNSFATLKSAEVKFKTAMSCLNAMQDAKNKDKDMLIPLTASLYVPGKLANTETVKVDVGTGYYVEKTIKEAKVFYNSKLLELRTNLDNLKATIEGKEENRQMVAMTIQRRMQAEQAAGRSA